jgi:hypothetical protein
VHSLAGGKLGSWNWNIRLTALFIHDALRKLDVPLDVAILKLRTFQVSPLQYADFDLMRRSLQGGFNNPLGKVWPYLIAIGVIGGAAALFGRGPLRQRLPLFVQSLRQPNFAPQDVPPPALHAPWPAYIEAGYPNRAYQLAAWCWAAIWTLIALPLVLLLAIPAVTIFFNFNAEGLPMAVARAKGFATGFLGWGRLWFGLMLLSLTSFAAFKVYGRYSLPKPFRPRVRVVRGTLRLLFLAVTLLSVGTFIAYLSEAAGSLYDDPIGRLLIQFLRDFLGI